MDRQLIRYPTGGFGTPVKHLDVTDSTNTRAFEWAEEGAPHGALVIAEEQTSGRGRAGRTWLGRRGEGLLFSVVLRPRFDPGTTQLVTQGIGVAVAEALAGFPPLNPRLKWPNDVWLDGRKVAGILVESRGLGTEEEVIVAGIGINTHWRTVDLPDEIKEVATSIAEALAPAAPPDRGLVLGAVLERLEAVLDLLGAEPEQIVRRAAELSALLGERVTVSAPGGASFEGIATRLLADGSLEIDTGGTTRALRAGDVDRIRS